MFCETCKSTHGPLYVCPSYSEEKKIEIRKLGRIFNEKCMNGTIPIIVNGKNINPNAIFE